MAHRKTTPIRDRRRSARVAAVDDAAGAADNAADDLIDDGREYQPEPLPYQPLPIPLPRGFVDDPGFVLRPFAVAGSAAVGSAGALQQIGVIGRLVRSGGLIAQSYNGCFAHGYFGPPDSGKSYIKGVHVENAVMPTPYLNQLVAPLCAVSLHYESGRHRVPDLLPAHLPNRVAGEVAELIRHHGSLPQGLPDCVCLTLKDRVKEARREHPHWQVHGLRFATRTLGVVGLKLLMGFSEREETLYGQVFEEVLRELGPDLGAPQVAAAIEVFPDLAGRRFLRERFRLARPFLDDDRPSPRGYLRPGRLLVVDLRDGWLAPARAMRVLAALNHVLFLADDGDGRPCNVLLCMDEVHKFCKYATLRGQLEFLVRERRHLGLSVLLLSQDPPSIPQAILDELDGVGVFRMDSARWRTVLGVEIGAFARLPMERFQRLAPWEMLFWSRRYCGVAPAVTPAATAATAALDTSPDGTMLLHVRVRPRLSQHGGATRVAAEHAAPAP